MYETTHFSKEGDAKFSCSCCGNGGLSISLLIVLEELRAHFGKPVLLTSGARCAEYNKKVGGAKQSVHITTEDEPLVDGADIAINGVSPTQIVVHLKSLPYANLLGIGEYRSWVHVDTRGYAARW